MALEVLWTDEALDQLDEITRHLGIQWGQKEINRFFQRLEDSITAISENPHTYKNSLRRPGTKEFLHSPQTTIFYSYDDQFIYVMLIWANRRDLSKLD